LVLSEDLLCGDAFFEKGFDPEELDGDGSFQLMLTSPKHEKVMAKALDNRGALYYLPLERREKKYKSGRAVNFVPVFSNYIFLRNGSLHKEYLFTFNKHFHSLVDVPASSREELWKDLCRLRTLLDAQAPIRACDELQVGDKVIIKTGALKGLEGAIVENRGALRFVVNVHFLGRSVMTELDPADMKLEYT
jgi:transcription antitermination factor NusG